MVKYKRNKPVKLEQTGERFFRTESAMNKEFFRLKAKGLDVIGRGFQPSKDRFAFFVRDE